MKSLYLFAFVVLCLLRLPLYAQESSPSASQPVYQPASPVSPELSENVTRDRMAEELATWERSRRQGWLGTALMPVTLAMSVAAPFVLPKLVEDSGDGVVLGILGMGVGGVFTAMLPGFGELKYGDPVKKRLQRITAIRGALILPVLISAVATELTDSPSETAQAQLVGYGALAVIGNLVITQIQYSSLREKVLRGEVRATAKHSVGPAVISRSDGSTTLGVGLWGSW